MHPTPPRPHFSPTHSLTRGLDKAIDTLVRALGLNAHFATLDVRVDPADVEADLRHGR